MLYDKLGNGWKWRWQPNQPSQEKMMMMMMMIVEAESERDTTTALHSSNFSPIKNHFLSSTKLVLPFQCQKRYDDDDDGKTRKWTIFYSLSWLSVVTNVKIVEMQSNTKLVVIDIIIIRSDLRHGTWWIQKEKSFSFIITWQSSRAPGLDELSS